MPVPYKHTQTGTLIIWIMGLAILVSILAAMIIPHYPALGRWITGFTVVVLAVCLFLFSSLTIEIDEENLAFWFGPGFIRKRIPIDQIVDCRVVRNKFWHGWGIRNYGTRWYCNCGEEWLYNVSGLDAVELELDSGKKLRIGTDQPAQLRDAISTVIDEA